MKRRHAATQFPTVCTTSQRLKEQAERLRKEEGTPPGIEREKLIRQARQAETASHAGMLSSPGLQPPR